MKIGIDASRAFLKNRTGIEEYSYQVIKHLRDKIRSHQVILYIRKNQQIDFELPENWKIKVIKWPRFWTQIGLSLEILFNSIDILFVPAHTVPAIHAKKSVVVVHGLEYEFCPKAYSVWEKFYMRFSIKNSCRWASEVICVSENTKKDLINLYKVSAEKIKVIYEGYEKEVKSQKSKVKSQLEVPYLLFIGRIEERKNIVNIVKAFNILKEQYNIEHKLVLAGRHGYGYGAVKAQIEQSKYRDDIIELGYIDEEEKWKLLKKADLFLFPTQYEGFGIPLLEAQSVGCPVVSSNNSSLVEVAGLSAILVDPNNYDQIAQAAYELISDKELKNAIIKKGVENVQRFSWEKCSSQIAQMLND